MFEEAKDYIIKVNISTIGAGENITGNLVSIQRTPSKAPNSTTTTLKTYALQTKNMAIEKQDTTQELTLMLTIAHNKN